MAGAITDLLDRVTDSTTGRPVIGSLASPGKAIAATSVNLADATNWTTTTAIHFSLFNTITVAGITVKDPTTQTDWKGTLAGLVISNLTLTGGTDRAYTAGAICELTPTARYGKDMYDWAIAHANQDGTLKTSAVQAALNIGTTSPDWTPLATPPSTVVYNGNRNYTVTVPGVDYTDRTQPGTRLKFQRTIAGPTQSTSLNGTTQFYSKTSPAGMIFTDDFVAGAWVKLTSYPTTDSGIISRYNGTSGWALGITSSSSGSQIFFAGWNAGAGNFSQVKSYQSLPLNKWVHVTAQLDMSTFTASTTTSYVMIDGLDVPAIVSRSGTNPTALVQAGNLEVGTFNATGFFPGKIAQAFVTSAKVTQATIQSNYYAQSISPTEPSVISSYTLNGVITDQNTTNANNLTASGSAVATNADSFNGTQASGLISSTLDYGLVQLSSYSGGNTTWNIQVPEGCTIPTSGGVSAVSYSTAAKPYGFPSAKRKWRVQSLISGSNIGKTGVTINVWYGQTASTFNAPIGDWIIGWRSPIYSTNSGATLSHSIYSLSTSLTAESHNELTTDLFSASNVSAMALTMPGNAETGIQLSTATPFYLTVSSPTSTDAGKVIVFDNSYAKAIIYADNALL